MYTFLPLLFLVFLVIVWFVKGPGLPPDAHTVFDNLDQNDIPELMPGKTKTTKSGDIKITYEVISNTTTPKGTILFVCGHSQTLLSWPGYFYQPMIDAGYQVIRYDNRGTGQSDWMKNWSKKNAYTLEDMAEDGVAVLDAENISKAHILGASMGGMIGQIISIAYPDRVLSLTSIMSSGFFYDPALINVPYKFNINFVRLFIRYKDVTKLKNRLKFNIGIRKQLRGNGNYAISTKLIYQQALYELKKRSGYNGNVTDQHSIAVEKSGSRYEELKKLAVPTLVIHGLADPLVDVGHSKKYAPMIANSTTLFVEGMGHDLPEIYMDQIHKAILNHVGKPSLEYS